MRYTILELSNCNDCQSIVHLPALESIEDQVSRVVYKHSHIYTNKDRYMYNMQLCLDIYLRRVLTRTRSYPAVDYVQFDSERDVDGAQVQTNQFSPKYTYIHTSVFTYVHVELYIDSHILHLSIYSNGTRKAAVNG